MPSYSEIAEKTSAASMSVFIGHSAEICKRETGEVPYSRAVAGSVVMSGNLPVADGKYALYCAVIVKRVDTKTRDKTGINE